MEIIAPSKIWNEVNTQVMRGYNKFDDVYVTMMIMMMMTPSMTFMIVLKISRLICPLFLVSVVFCSVLRTCAETERWTDGQTKQNIEMRKPHLKRRMNVCMDKDAVLENGVFNEHRDKPIF